MFYQLIVKVNRKSKYRWYRYARVTSFVKGTHPDGHNWHLEADDGTEFTGITISDCLWSWYRYYDITRGLWVPTYKNAISQVDRSNKRVQEIWS